MNILVNGQSPERQFFDAPPGEFPASPEVGDTTAVDGRQVTLEALKRPLEHGVLDVPPQEAFPDFPVEINLPQFYYLYVGATP